MSLPANGRVVNTEPEESPRPAVPWHFKLMVGLAVVYVGWRVVQMIGWLFDWVASRV